MVKNKVIKNTFDKNISKEDIYSNVIRMYEGRKAGKLVPFWRVAICLIGFFLIVISLFNSGDSIYFNELNGIGVQNARNGFGVHIPVNYNYFEYIDLPNNIVNKESYIVYENRIVEKNVINYYGDDIEINIYFSANTLNQELNSTTKECSKIKGQDIKLYKYENVYIAEFNYDNMHYQIKGCNISEKEFIILLKSIIK